MVTLETRIESMRQAFYRMSDISNSNFKIMGRLLATLEVLKDKGMFTDEEVKNKFKELDAARETTAKNELELERARLIAEKEAQSDVREGNPPASSVQPENIGSDENSVGVSQS